MVHKVIIIGSGPAGLTAGVYTGRAKLAPIVFQGRQPGGQLMTTTDVENWPGDISVKGPALMIRMQEHAKAYGATLIDETIAKVDLFERPYKLYTETGKEYKTETIIIGSGASHKKLGVPGEKEYWGRGITTCATCDAPFYMDKEVVIAGGGNTAVTEASVLTNFASKVTMIQILDELSANDPLKDSVLVDPKVDIIYSHAITEIRGDGKKIQEIVIADQNTNETRIIPASGLFVAIGFKPNTGLFADQLQMDEWGYLKLTGYTQTSKEGVFAAGDVSDYRYMQAITSAGFGCMAALDAESYLRKLAS